MQKQAKPTICDFETDDVEYLICHAAMLWRRLVAIKIKSLGVSITEKRILFCIARNPGLTQVQIAKLLDLEPQNLMRSLDKMEKQNWIEKQADPKDRRVKCLRTTPHAKKIISKINAVADEVKLQVLGEMNPKKIQGAVNHITEIRENLLALLKDLDSV
jgi:MarR family transcriptional regulator for hemolysin